MEDSKRRAFIKQQAAAKKKLKGSLPLKGQANPLTKRKLSEKVDHQSKKPKVLTGSVVGETPAASKLPPKPGLGKGKGLMMGQGPVTEKRPVLLREDPQYMLKQLLSIIKGDNYEDLGNHATEAMRETGLYSLAQVSIRPYFLPVVLVCCSLFFSSFPFFLQGGANDEGTPGLLPITRDGGGPCEGKG